MKRMRSVASLRAMTNSGGLPRELREMAPALLEVRVLVEGGARRREEDRLAGTRELGRAGDRLLHGAAALHVDRRRHRLSDRGSRLADHEDLSRRPGDRRSQPGEIAVLVPAPEDEEDASLALPLERL